MSQFPRSQHPASGASGGLRLYGRRVMLRPLVGPDFTAWGEVRRTNEGWLTQWEPSRAPGAPDPARIRDAFLARCSSRDKERQYGQAHSFGVFVNGLISGEINLNNVQRGAAQTATLGYWIDERRAGHGFIPEGVVIALRHGFEDLRLHRVEICIVPRNHNSRRVAEKLMIREEGVALRFLEIAGEWEDHIRYAMTVEEWAVRRDDLAKRWLAPKSSTDA